MNSEQAFSVWAPEDAPWSPWVKPVLFAYLNAVADAEPLAPPACDLSAVPAANERAALVLDLPGPLGALLAVPLARRGYRPIPLYNALPMSDNQPRADDDEAPIEAVDVLPIIHALRQGSEALAELMLPPTAPPAFLLDERRHGGAVSDADFDNRSVSFPSDFPSARFFRQHDIARIVLIQRDEGTPHEDLSHSLRAFQDAGLAIERQELDVRAPARPYLVPRPPWYRSVLQRALLSLGFQHRVGFGAMVRSDGGGGG